jgi:hypothetical protein
VIVRGKPMQEANRSIFRVDALQRYTHHREAAVLPRQISPCTFRCLWLLLGLLVASTILAWCARVPVYASGSAVMIDGGNSSPATTEEVLIVAFIPPEHLWRLRVGQVLLLQFDGRSKPLGTPIMAVEPEVSSPQMARRRFGLGESAAQAIAHPSAIALARLQPLPSGLPAAAYVGSIFRAQIEVDSRRVISMLPLLGQFFGE